jgi:hypothetical protein
MGILEILLIGILLGFLTWAAITIIPMSDLFKQKLPIIIFVLYILFILSLFITPFHDIYIGHR